MNIVNTVQKREEGFASNTRRSDTDSEPPVFACRFSTKPGYEEILGLANEEGQIALQDTTIKGRNNVPLDGVQAHANAIFDLAWMPGELKLVTVAGDHTARLWDVSMFGRSQTKELCCYSSHTRSVKTVAFRYQDKAVFATGARDGVIMIWDIRAKHLHQPRPDNCIMYGHPNGSTFKKRRKLLQPSRSQSITGLIFQDDFTLISCAAGDGFIKIWDIRKNYTVHKREPIAKHQIKYAGNSSRNGFSSLSLCPGRITLFASCMDHVIYAYNLSSYSHEPLGTYYGHQNHTYYVKTCLSADGRYLASGSSDNLAYIWRINKPGRPLIKLSGHREEVTCISWCSVGDLKIVTCSDDSCHRIWRVGYEHKVENEEVEICGRAQPVTEENIYTKRIETPSTNTRYCDRTPSSSNNSFAIPGPSNEHNANRHEEDQNTPKTNTMKRSYSQMMVRARSEGKSKFVLSPIGENSEVIAKQMRIEHRGARRLLFGTGTEDIPSSSKNYDSDESHASESTSANDRNTEILPSPTVNLPNFVMDGTAPHLSQMSPQKQKENVDWLTKIRKEKYEQKIGKFTLGRSSSPKSQATPARRIVRSRSHDPQKESKATNNSVFSLLDFFKALNSDCGKNPSTEDSSDIPSTSDNKSRH
ncbi:protein lethal(2)denticleless isoform X2 [Odontomachus brunneus]|uniref:protein lethal(2)denticleless isoform X2 n=1 Tax=Odontomachus brunneus TaxID=486640 RepID=UPI0013F1E746|nr:protein lethal(2)denticleless isoform X2 [Odontomachus brunneus]